MTSGKSEIERIQSDTESIEVRPMSGCIGAEIGGVDLRRPLSPTQAEDIRSALLKWKVVFFRDQQIGHPEQIAFARYFGELTGGHPLGDSSLAPKGFPEIFVLPKASFVAGIGKPIQREPRWHCDMTALVNPPWGSMLRADKVPEYGGDTMWTNQVAAYEGMPSPMRDLADSLRAVHEFDFTKTDKSLKVYRERLQATPYVAEHPVVRVHPETGEKALWVNPGFTTRIVDLTRQESRNVLTLFFDEIDRPEYTVRFRWASGSVALWDNRSCAHRAPADLHFLSHEFDREMYRVTLAGDIPVGPDGSPSRALAGEPLPVQPR